MFFTLKFMHSRNHFCKLEVLAEVLAEPYYRVWHCVKSRQTGFKYGGGRERERERVFLLLETVM